MTDNLKATPDLETALDELRASLVALAESLASDGTDASMPMPRSIEDQLHALLDVHDDLRGVVSDRPALREIGRDRTIEVFGEMLGAIGCLFQPSGREVASKVRRDLHESRISEMARETLTRRQEANAIVSYTFRTGYLETLHAGKSSPLLDDPELSRITDAEIKRLMIECCRKLDRLLRLREADPETYWTKIAHHAMYTQVWEQD